MSQLTNPEFFDESNIIFSKAKKEQIPKQKMHYYRIPISTKYPDGTTGELILPSEKLFTFGVSENKSVETSELTGYSLSLCLYSKDGATEKELQFENAIKAIVNACTAHLLKDEIKLSVAQFDLVASDLRKMDIIYRKRGDDGKIVADKSPMIYPKLVTRRDKKTQELKVQTTFYEEGKFNPDGTPTEISLKDMLGAYGHGVGAIRFESIYIGGGKHRIQYKVIEADIRKLGGGKSQLLRRPKVGGNLTGQIADLMGRTSQLQITNGSSGLGLSDEEREKEKNAQK
jgi:hypothetical protein